MKLLQTFMGMLENHGKYRTQALLRRMPEEQLRDMGISPELLAEGVKGWPWQNPTSDDASPVMLRPVSLAPVKVEDVKHKPAVAHNTIVETQKQQTAA